MFNVPKLVFTGQDNVTPVINRVNTSMNRLTNRLGRSEGFLVRNRRAFQQVGFQVGDFATQIAGGQSAMLAFTQQGGQLLQFFGPLGAVVAGLVAVFGSFYIALSRSGGSMGDMAQYMGVLQPAFESLGRVVSQVKELMFDSINLIVNNLDTLLLTGAAVATFYGVKFVAAFIAARGAMMTVGAAGMWLEGVFKRILPVALLIGLVKLVQTFYEVVKATGSIGAALTALEPVAAGVWEAIQYSATGAFQWIGAQMNKLAATILSALQGPITDAWDSFINGIGESTVAVLNLFEDGSPFKWRTQSMAKDIAVLKKRAEELESAANTSFGNATGAIWNANKALEELIGTGTDFDIRDLFGGGADGAGGAGGGGGAAKKTIDEIKKATEELANTVGGMLKTAFTDLIGTIWEGGRNAGKILMDLGKQMVNLALQMALFRGLGNAFPGTFGSGGTMPLMNANGNVFSRGRVQPFANGGIVSRPTIFPMKNGSGLMGEAGPEAIMPLARGADGKLGVRSSGGGSGGDTIQIINNTGAKVSYQREDQGDGTAIKRFVIDENRKAMARGEFDQAQSSRYGSKPMGVKR